MNKMEICFSNKHMMGSFSVVNLLVDILYAFVDPRIKSQYKKNGKKLALRAKKQEA